MMHPEAIERAASLSLEEVQAYARSSRLWRYRDIRLIYITEQKQARQIGCSGCLHQDASYIVYYHATYGSSSYRLMFCATCLDDLRNSLGPINSMFTAVNLGDRVLVFKRLCVILTICHGDRSYYACNNSLYVCSWCSRDGPWGDVSYGFCKEHRNLPFDIDHSSKEYDEQYLSQTAQKLLLMRDQGINKDILGILAPIMWHLRTQTKCAALISKFISVESTKAA